MAESIGFSRRIDSPSDTDEEAYDEYCDNFTYSLVRSCCVCNGYYGPNFGEPVCGTCHAFLFPLIEEIPLTDLSDNDEDSGNDEPPYSSQRDPPAPLIDNDNDAAAALDDNMDNDIEVLDDLPLRRPFIGPLFNMIDEIRPEPDPPRSLRSLLNALGDNAEQAVPAAGQANVARKEPIGTFPVEVLLKIFSYLDDISLAAASQVCKQWQSIVGTHTPPSMWQRYTRRRFPLFRQITATDDWFKIYNSLISSCFCTNCLIQMAQPIPQQREDHFGPRRLRAEMRTSNIDAPEGVEAVPLDDQLSRWQASIIGPPNSPYEGGKFFLYIIIPFSYPFYPPVVRFLTKIIHPNVSRHGDVGIDIIQHNWSYALSIYKVLLSVQSLLTDPFTQICMEPELGRLYEEDRFRFEALARRWTYKHAMLEVIP